MLKKGVIYCRVSSKEQREEGFSIPAQQKLLKEYALKNSIEIVREYADAETAKSIGREQFGEMVKFLKASADVKTILVEKTDRLYRNFTDYVAIDGMDTEIHLVKEGEILSKDSKSHQKFIHGIKVLMAKNYIDNLSEEVKKGLYEKAANGQYPGQAPSGYLNDREKRVMVIDPKTSPLVKRMFEMYSTGEYSLDSLFEWARDNGLWSKHGKVLSRSNLEHILKNPFYYGTFVYSGKQYPGTHQPLVSKQLWDDVQRAFKRRYKKDYEHKDEFMFPALMTCAECGHTVVAEIKKGKYIYYHCNRAVKTCSLKSKYVKEEYLAKQFENVMQEIKVSEGTVDTVVTALKKSYEDKNTYRDDEITGLRKKIDVLRGRIDQAYLDKLDGKITEEFWKENTNSWQFEMDTLSAKLTAFNKADVPYYENGRMILELARNAHQLYLRATRDEKRKLLNMVLSNCKLNGATIEYQMKNPFNLMAKWASHPTVLRD